MTDVNKMCRVCLGNVKKRDKSIVEKYINHPIFHHIMSIAGVKISVNDDSPDKICQLCFKELQTSIHFKRKCEESNAVLRETFVVHTKSNLTQPHHSEAKIKKEYDSEKEDEILYDPELLAHDVINKVSKCRASLFDNDGGSIQLKNFHDVATTQNNIDNSPLHDYDDDAQNYQYDYSGDVKNESEQISGVAYETNSEEIHCYYELNESSLSLQRDTEGDHGLPQCDDCKEYFKNKMKLQVHWKRVHLPALLTCTSCQRTFKTFKALRGHQQKQPNTCVAAANFLIQVTGKYKICICKLCGIKCERSQMCYHYFTMHTDKNSLPISQNKDNQGSLPPKKDENSYRIDLHLQCDDCKEFYRTKAKLSVHWKRVHMHQRLVCQICKKRFGNFKTLNSHQKKKPITCTESVNFNIEHVGRRRLFHCKLCSYKQYQIMHMIQHNRVHTGDRPYTCTKCGSSYRDRVSLSVHMECAHKEYKMITSCQYCGILLEGSSKIRYHMEKHKIHPEVKCELCAKTLKNKKSLKNHMKIHTEEKKYQCEHCPRRFYTMSAYNFHKKQGHAHVKVKKIGRLLKKISCAHCSYESASVTCILKHQKKHEVCEFSCSICGLFVKSAQSLQAHIQTIRHCPHCDKKFCGKGGNLYRHIKIHSHEANVELKDEDESH